MLPREKSVLGILTLSYLLAVATSLPYLSPLPLALATLAHLLHLFTFDPVFYAKAPKQFYALAFPQSSALPSLPRPRQGDVWFIPTCLYMRPVPPRRGLLAYRTIVILLVLSSAVQAVDVWKRFSSGWVLRSVSLDVRSVVVIYGANGSGKTTLVKILAGLVPPTRGEVRRLGRVGAALQQPMMHPDLTVEENLKFYAGALKADYREVVELFSLEKHLRAKFSHLSYGWRRRADLARALLGAPEALLLDEPMLGLDAEGRRTVAEVVRRFKGPAVVTASSTCDYVEVGAEAWFELREGMLRPTAPTCGPT